MSVLDRSFKKANPALTKEDGTAKTSGELIAEVTGGANLVDGKQTWEHAEAQKNDIEFMKRCCDAELKTMAVSGIAPSPFYFERVAILSRKQKNYRQEVEFCERYIQVVEEFYLTSGQEGYADVRKGPRYQAMLARLPKARELLTTTRSTS